MNECRQDLAWHMYPEPDGKDYSPNGLSDDNTVESIFNACRIGEALILGKVRKHLFTIFGMMGLIRINKRSFRFAGDFYDTI